jgi:hypothetical protein
VLLVVPASVAAAIAPGAAEVRAYHTASEAAAALQSPGWDTAVLLSDAIPPADEDALATVVRAAGRPVIEVRRERWDGETWSPLTAACRGIVSGFGLAGVAAAARAAAR